MGILLFQLIHVHCFNDGKVKLPAQSQQEILGELTSIPQLKEALNTVETLMAFLTGGSSMSVEMNLSKYAESLKIKLCSKVQPFAYVGLA